MAELRLEGVKKSFGETEVLKGIDLSIDEGDFVVLLGPSGCGKSTLLRLIAGLESLTDGDILSGGQSVRERSPRDRGVAMVFQSYALYPHLNVFENMAFSLRMQKLSEADIKTAVHHAAQMLGIQALLDRKPKALSGGQRQRVAIGRAIVRKPELFLLDEPLSNLDAGLRVHMRHEFARLHRELKTTMIYVTHDQVEAMTLATKIAVLNAGHLEQVGEPLKIYHHPKNLFVATFLGSPRINLIKGHLVNRSVDQAEVAIAGDMRFKIALDPMVAQPQVSIGDVVTLGVRPECLKPVSSKSGPVNRLGMTVDIVETLGGAVAVYGAIVGEDTRICALLPPQGHCHSGDQIQLGFDPVDAYLFAEDGTAFGRP